MISDHGQRSEVSKQDWIMKTDGAEKLKKLH